MRFLTELENEALSVNINKLAKKKFRSLKSKWLTGSTFSSDNLTELNE